MLAVFICAVDHPVELSLQRTDRAVHIQELAFVAVAGPLSRAGIGAQQRPNAHHAARSRLVLEHQPYPGDRERPGASARLPAPGGVSFPLLLRRGLALGVLGIGSHLFASRGAPACDTPPGAHGPPRVSGPTRRAAATPPTCRLRPTPWPRAAGKLRSCSMLIAARRRPPHLGAGWEGCATRMRKRAWYLATVARPIPNTAAVCSSVESNSPGSNTACATQFVRRLGLQCKRLRLRHQPHVYRRGLAMPFSRRHRRPRACHS